MPIREIRGFENFVPHEEYGRFFAAIAPYIGERKSEKTGSIEFQDEILDEKLKLFPLEIRESMDLLWVCDRYMTSDEERRLVRTALAISLIAHQDQYRDSREPYSIHPLWIARALVDKYHVDAMTAASALLHDTFENTNLKENIKNYIPLEVFETVEALSKAKGSKLRKEAIDEENRLRIMESLVNNPRVAIIKIYDRLHNMRTLHFKSRRPDRLAIITETEEIYIPLAKRLGMFEEAEELDDLCLSQMDEEHLQFSIHAKEGIRDYFYQGVSVASLIEELPKFADLVTDRRLAFHYRRPGAHDIYRNIGDIKKVIVPSDYYLNVDIELLDFTDPNAKQDWSETAIQTVTSLMASGFLVDPNFNLADFQKEYYLGLSDSLSVNFTRVSDGYRLRLNIFPEYTYRMEQLNMGYLYERALNTSRKKERLPATDGDPYTQRHYSALKKHAFLKARYAYVTENWEPGASFSFLRLLAPRLPVGYMRINGVDDAGREQRWPIKIGSSALDFAKMIFTKSWPAVQSIQVKRDGRFVDVPFDYILSPGETVHIVKRPKEEHVYPPRWIYCFKTDEDGRRTVHDRIKAIIEAEVVQDIEEMKSRVIMLGHELIESHLDEADRPLHTGLLGYARELIVNKFGEISDADFLLKVGMGEADEQTVLEVANALVELNRNVATVRINFRRDAAGQTEAVTSEVLRMDISMLGNKSTSYSQDGPTIVEFYLSPEQLGEVESIIVAILRSKRCRELGMTSIVFHTKRERRMYLVKNG